MTALVKWSDEWEMVNEARKDVPVDVTRLAKDLKVAVTSAFLNPKISGMIERRPSGYVITVNHGDPSTRMRFTIAHELGHYMLHRSLIGDGIDDDRAYRSTEVGKYHNTAIGPHEETEANQFAANLLMPLETVNRVYSELRSVREVAKLFEVSEHAMSIRLGIPYVR